MKSSKWHDPTFVQILNRKKNLCKNNLDSEKYTSEDYK